MSEGTTVPTLDEFNKLRAQYQVLREDVSNLQDWRDQCNCGTVDIDPPITEPERPTTPAPASGNFAGVPAELLVLEPGYRDKKGRTMARVTGGWEVPDGNGGILHTFDKVLVADGRWRGDGDHFGFGLNDVDEAYIIDSVFDDLQQLYQANGPNTHTILRNVVMRNVREDAIRNVKGLIEDVTIESAKPFGKNAPKDKKPHGDTIDLKNFTDGLTIRNLRSLTGNMNGIITAAVRNIVIDGYEHLGGPDHLSIDIGGDAENVTIRNAKLSGGIRFRGKQTNVNIDWNTVRTNVPREEFA